MEQKKPNDHVKVVVTFLCIIAAVAFTGIVYSYQLNIVQNQIIDAQAANLVNVSLGYTDNGQGVLHISGYVYNAGTLTAYHSGVQVDFYNGSEKTNSTSIPIGHYVTEKVYGTTIGADGAVEGGTSYYVYENLTYTGNPPTKVTFTLGWGY
jgi:hypothetical protein